MATGIPTFRVDLAEGMIDVNSTSADRLFAYCIEADRGPINVPTFVASNREALKIFGVDFAPHFYQGSTGLYIIRVGFEGAQPAKVEYKANINGQEKTVLTITSVYSGPSKHAVKIRKALSNEGLNVTIDIDGITSKNYQNLKDIRKVAERINSRFGEYVIATLNSEVNYADFTNNDLIINEETDDGKLVGGTNGYMLNKNGELAGKGFSELTVLTHGDDPEESDPYRGNTYWIDTSAAIGGGKYALFTNSKGTTEAGVYVVITAINNGVYTFTSYASNTDNAEALSQGTYELTGEVDHEDYTDVDDASKGINSGASEPNNDTAPSVNKTLQIAYEKAFDKSSYVDVIGVTSLSDKDIVRTALLSHIDYMIDPEVHSFRFGITSVLPTDDLDGVRTIQSLCDLAANLDSEWIICIGQGVKFQPELGSPVDLPPHKAIQLFTGIRSSLGYSEAIFGGEQKKVLKGVVDTLPITNDNVTLIKDDIIDLNEAGICTFKKEYDEITFIEGVTTIQDNESPLSYENIMSIVAYVIKRLTTIAKPYQGQRLTEDLKSTLQTALNSELNNITTSDGTLMPLEEFNIPPFDVQVFSAGKTKFNDAGTRLIRESKIIIQARIVPIGALRDIDLHVIAI